ANGGVGVQPHVIERVKTAAGRLLYSRKGASNGRVIEAIYLPMMNAMMQETLLTGTARKGDVPGWQAAGKTGTSQDWRDAWFVGYTSHLVTGVWLGNDDSSPTKKASGGNLPVEIWSRYMRVAHDGLAPQPLPGGIWQGPAEAAPGWPGFFAPQTPGPLAQGAETAAAPAPATQSPRGRGDSLAPPGLIPNPATTAQARPGRRERNFFEQLFGGG
ncbi:MAG: penicillin-binding transpeptidase domain-containing protein, partial [Methylocella sp.]